MLIMLARFPVVSLAAALLLLPLSARAVDPPPAASAAPAIAPGAKADMLVWIEDAEKKLLDLTSAMPEAKYAWSPGKGVRSVGEVFVHVISANYNLPSKAGVKPPPSFDAKTIDKTLTKKADIVAALRDSFAHAKRALADTTDTALDGTVDLFGNKSTVRGVYLLLLSHGQEHLGQSIAYARFNNLTPPWTERRAAKAQ